MVRVRVLGAGPAGGAAALAALQHGADVHLFEKTPFPRHKVCGEFLSPESALVLDQLGLSDAFAACKPARLRRMLLDFGRTRKQGLLAEPGFGLSRRALDQLMLETAITRGAVFNREKAEPAGPTVIATGRHATPSKGERLFGFKAHFTGPVNDSVEMYFLSKRAYVGISAVENGFTNVCGLAEESSLAPLRFDIDAYLTRHQSLRARLKPLTRAWDWMIVGPLLFRHHLRESAAPAQYLAGDALSFIDPFTGSGLLSALITGRMAGVAAANGLDANTHLNNCRRRLLKPFKTTAFFRMALSQGWGQWAAPLLPASLLMRLTRPAAG